MGIFTVPPFYDPGIHGSLNVPIEHHPTIRYMVYNGYYKVMSNSPKMGHLPTPGIPIDHMGVSENSVITPKPNG